MVRGDEDAEEGGELDAYKAKLAKTAEELVRTKFPAKTLAMDALLGQALSLSRLGGVHVAVPIPISTAAQVAAGGEKAGGKVLRCPRVSSNGLLCELEELLKPLLWEAAEDVTTIQMWISFNIPRIEDGNNFGVEVQQETLGDVKAMERDIGVWTAHLQSAPAERAGLVLNVVKFPDLDDFRRALRAHDEAAFHALRHVAIGLRDHFASVHDTLTKNLAKIKQPRTSHSEYLA